MTAQKQINVLFLLHYTLSRNLKLELINQHYECYNDITSYVCMYIFVGQVCVLPLSL